MNVRFHLVLVFCLAVQCAPFALSEQPNVLVLLTDDQRFDDFNETFMPVTKREVCDKGLDFKKAYVTTPACCPSRSSIFTGMYTSQHGVRANPYQLKKPTFAELLNGHYFAGHVGKYLNTWNGSRRPEFDFWVAFAGGSQDYKDPTLNVNGEWKAVDGYITDIFGSKALEFLEASLRQDKPFLLHLSFNAPHYPATPPKEDKGRFAALLSNPRPPSFNTSVQQRQDKPVWLRKKRAWNAQEIAGNDSFRGHQRETLPAVDRAVEDILSWLETHDQLSNTLIFFLSDNGVMSGEHSLKSKDTVYEEAIHVPYCVRWDGHFPARESDALVANIDIAPTIFASAGQAVPPTFAGVSLLPLAEEDAPWREELLIEGFRRSGGRRPFAAVHTGRYVFVENSTKGNKFDINRTELYDLATDPYELVNLTHDPVHSEVKNDLRIRLNELLRNFRGSRSFIVPKGIKGPARFPNPLRRKEKSS
ncbi:MAG: sulfatase-like hydrolase/transferase [Bdellovibrionales bacterium]|nr:sulfatase-like hydrolase/transferase [Bdellovibrionales bacterium]